MAVGIYSLVKVRKEKLFNSSSLETMLITPARLKGVVVDPCQYYLKGEPLGFPDNYVKLQFVCADDHKSASTLALPAIKDQTLAGVIKELARIQGFRVKEDKNGQIIGLGNLINTSEREWRCLDLGEKNIKILAFSYRPRARDNLACFYFTVEEIKSSLKSNLK